MSNLQANWARGISGQDGYRQTACDFIQANLAKTLAWIPNDLECAAGTGVRTADGGYELTTREEASYCEWCPPGRFSNPILLTSVSHANIQTYRCDACPAGQKQTTGGSTFCEDCSSGTFSSSPGTVKCSLCPIGQYIPTNGASRCERCPAPMVTATPATKSERKPADFRLSAYVLLARSVRVGRLLHPTHFAKVAHATKMSTCQRPAQHAFHALRAWIANQVLMRRICLAMPLWSPRV